MKTLTRETVRLCDLDAPDPEIRHVTARLAWRIVSRLNYQRARRLYDRYASELPGSPEWRIAELARLRLYILTQEQDGGEMCPLGGCWRSGLWLVTDCGNVQCHCRIAAS